MPVLLQIYESAIFQAQISASYNSHQSWQQVDKELILCFAEFQRMGECWLTYWTSNGRRKEASPHEIEANADRSRRRRQPGRPQLPNTA